MISIKNMSFSYEKINDTILKNMNLEIPNGIYLSILGENGSCKTTLIKLILGLLTPDQGTISVDTKKVSYLPQHIDNYNSAFPISVYEILKAHAKSLHLDVNSSICKVLKEVNMEDFKHSLIGNLSGGQQQRIFIARAIMGDPELLILDEPSTGVDQKNIKDIYSIFHQLNLNNTTIISVEHNVDIALEYSTHILKIKEGRITLETAKEFEKQLCIKETNKNVSI